VADREHLVRGLAHLGLRPVGPAAGPFVLVRAPVGADLREALRHRGFAVRRGDTFPGLGPDWVRVAVRAPEVSDALLAAVAEALRLRAAGDPAAQRLGRSTQARAGRAP
jgi:histidinol-phosphate aminotransferase